MLIAKFQTNDKPWSVDPILQQDWAQEWARRMRPFLGPFHERMQGDQFGPYRKRSDAVHHVVVRMDAQSEPGTTFFVANKNGKGVRAHMVHAGPEMFGPVFHTTGPCRDDYPNIITDHNLAGQLVIMQKPAMLAYHMAEELNGRAIRITGVGQRSCETQQHLYNTSNPPGRFAKPEVSRHCRALAIDVENTPENLTPKARWALEEVGFCFGVPGEPWHCAFTECG